MGARSEDPRPRHPSAHQVASDAACSGGDFVGKRGSGTDHFTASEGPRGHEAAPGYLGIRTRGALVPWTRISHVTSIAYRAEPPQPGWGWAVGALLGGWIVAGSATFLLYLGADLVGAISHSSALTYPSTGVEVHGIALNDWPYPHNGPWSVLANMAVVLLVLVVTTKATSWWMRRSYERFSEGRLGLVLLLTGWLPLKMGGPVGGFLGFLVASVLIRHWVVHRQDRLPNRAAIAIVGVLATFAAVYGLLHPLWTAYMPSGTPRADRATIVIHNAAQVPVTVDGFKVSPAFNRPPGGFKLTPGSTARLRGAFSFPARSDRFLTQPLPQGCGTMRVGIHVHYHVFGIPLSQTVPADVPLGRHC